MLSSSGALLEAPAALRLGLVNQLVPAEQFDSGLEQLRQAFDTRFDTVLRELGQLIEQRLASPEVQAASATWRRRRAQQRDGERQGPAPAACRDGLQ